jgi:tripartite-type tricarboxylate transporter receptor subunit TctC
MLLSVGLMAPGAGVVSGQDYPNKPIRIVTGLAGGGGDSVARIIAQGISGPLGQSVIVDNRTTIQASEAASKAPPDGYTLLVIGSSVWIFPLLQKAPYEVSDFSPISLISREINVVSVHPSVPVKSIKELIALAKARPGALNYGAGVIGGPQHLAAELFKSMAGVDIVRISYKGNAQSITGLISGEVQLMITDVGLLAPHVKMGRLRALAVTSLEPSALAPGLPTVAASGLPGYEAVGMTVMMAPANTPSAIINRLNQEIVRFLNRSDVKERFLNDGEEVVANSPEQFAAIIKSDMARISKVIKDAGIKVN